MLGNTMVSLIRTYVPIGVGWLVAFIAESTGFVLDDNSKVSLTAFFVAIVSALYYLLVRLAEHLNPSFGWLLGFAVRPAYVKTANVERSLGIHPPAPPTK